MYDVEKIIYLLVGLVVFGNTFLFMGFVMTVEDRKNEKRKRKPRSKAKGKAKAKRKSNKKDEPINKIMDDDDIIIEEIDN